MTLKEVKALKKEMARIKGGKLTVIYDSTKRQPLDGRMLVTKYVDLINPNTWIPTGMNTDSTFNGMIVSVNADSDKNGVYYLNNRQAITADNYTAYQAALANNEDITPYFTMWTKLASASDFTPTFEAIVDGGEITE